MTNLKFFSQRGSSISTHTSLAGRDISNHSSANSSQISTHTSLAGRDGSAIDRAAELGNISTHTSLAGRDVKYNSQYFAYHAFLLTRPSRDVTRVGGVMSRNPG